MSRKKKRKINTKNIFKTLLFLIIAGSFIAFCLMRNDKPLKEEKPTEAPIETPDPKPVEKPDEPVADDPEAILTKQLKQEKYYIPDNLERYLAYSDGKKTAKQIVTEVNCNIDRPFYTDIKKTDLSKGYLMLVNKYYALDKDYVLTDKKTLSTNYTYWEGSALATDAYDSYIKMLDDGRSEGYKLIDTSSLRSYEYQDYLFNNYVKNNGMEWALKSSAKPGHSEHETGLASDIVKNGVSMYDFGSTAEFVWLKNNAHKYGFILRYPEGKEYLTGYKYEPWHYRYVGNKAAKYIYENNITFEEYYAYFCEYKGEC